MLRAKTHLMWSLSASFFLLGNSNEDCFPMTTSPLRINLHGFENFQDFTWVFCLLLLGPMIVICAISHFVDRHKVVRGTPGLVPQAEAAMSNSSNTNEYALMTIGAGSVYSFVLGSSYVGRAIALVTIGLQFTILVPFINAADYDLSNDKVQKSD